MDKNSFSIRFDLRLVCLLLLAIIAGMLAVWRPWEDANVKRTISVSGDAKIESIPDEYIFTPYFQKTGDDSDELRNEIAALGEKLVRDLKELGVDENKISLSGSSYDYYYYRDDDGKQNIQLRAQVTVNDKELAQKVQDYLLTQDIKGQITPRPQFSDQRQDELKEQARSEAVVDAKAEAQRTAEDLGLKLGKVVMIKDSENVAYPWLQGVPEVAFDDASRESSSLPVTPGEQTFSFRVEASFELK